jgi:hypothetical protein
MTELFSAISKNFTFASLCKWIKMNENGMIEFELKYSFYGSKEDVYCIQKLDNHLIISDMGNTLKNLDKVFEIFESEVKKNIFSVLKYYNISAIYNSFVYKLDTEKDIVPQIQLYLQGINFLYAMKVFYQ